ncbi:molybdopterin biosynthesis protein MoeA [Deferribacter desulfuricans SSM1]|uniref:Molybdopterin molybdenumtransferase n=1 Tax=Deferribacter desulfuricans (strain DSM 14783 / JCM 11476 / NBRC 101012 / SSM1) TaxID=639282 RepID=D3PD20_DEFDS|nr:molybdopterin molybdotransferase MoeA [Deferribacter desulfuricans]BAI80493.1 molybdopterin biosynthesis protein MoeA [Deferribacter desulfuricans SSM1]
MNNFTDLYDAFKIIDSLTIKRNYHLINIENAFGKVSYKDIYAPISIPEYNISKMDGYAVNSSICDFTKPFQIIGEIFAGEEIKYNLKENEAYKVATGAKLSHNIDKVIPIENSYKKDGNLFLIKQDKNFIQPKGSLIKEGEKILSKGDIIDHRIIELLASLRINCIETFKPIRIGIISTGSELTELFANSNNTLNSNYYMIFSFLKNFDTEVTYLGIEKDDFNAIKSKIESSINEYDILITIGGTGFSKADLIIDIINSLKGKILINGINASPGKTFKLATLENKPIFIIPGNPQSAIVCTELFIGFFLRGISRKNLLIKIPVNFSLIKKRGFYKIIKTITTVESNQLLNYDLYQKKSKGFRSLTIIDKDIENLKEGDLCDTFLLFYL